MAGLSKCSFEAADNAESSVAKHTCLSRHPGQTKADGVVANRTEKSRFVLGSSPSIGTILGWDHEGTTEICLCQNPRISAVFRGRCESCRRTIHSLGTTKLASERAFERMFSRVWLGSALVGKNASSRSSGHLGQFRGSPHTRPQYPRISHRWARRCLPGMSDQASARGHGTVGLMRGRRAVAL